MDKRVGIVMPCINLWDKYTRPAILSLAPAITAAYEHGIESRFLLIDNASSDNTKEMASQMKLMLTSGPLREENLMTYHRMLPRPKADKETERC